jgi:hypothetical protein
MFVRIKPAGRHRYLQIAQNYREGKKVISENAALRQ